MNPMTWLCDVTLHKQSRHRGESASKQWLHQPRNVSIQFDSVKTNFLGY